MPKKATQRTFWERVREASRGRFGPRGATQVQAARLAGVKQPSVSLWNKSGGAPELGNAIRLAVELGVCVEWLYTERGPMLPGAPDDAYARELWKFWAQLSDDDKRDVLGAVRLKSARQPKPEPPTFPRERPRHEMS